MDARRFWLGVGTREFRAYRSLEMLPLRYCLYNGHALGQWNTRVVASATAERQPTCAAYTVVGQDPYMRVCYLRSPIGSRTTPCARRLVSCLSCALKLLYATRTSLQVGTYTRQTLKCAGTLVEVTQTARAAPADAALSACEFARVFAEQSGVTCYWHKSANAPASCRQQCRGIYAGKIDHVLRSD